MESQTMMIDDKIPNDDDVMKKRHSRDSESEDLNIAQQKSNFHQNAFFFNIHTFMKENMMNLQHSLIKDMISMQNNIVSSRRKSSIPNAIFT